MNIALWLDRAAVHGTRPALFDGTEMVADYAAFHAAAHGIAGALAARGVGPGDRVALFAKNGPDYLPALFAIWIAGAAAVPINAKLHPREAAWIIENAGASLAFTSAALGAGLAPEVAIPLVSFGSPDFARMRAHAPAETATRGEEDLAWLFYTSGTTGRPKGVVITHGMLRAMALTYFADVDPVSPEDAALYAAPMSHGAGLYALMHVLMGARHVLPPSGGFEPAEIFALAKAHGHLHMFAAPTMVKRMTEAAKAYGESGEGLRTIVYGGGPMYVADIVEAVDLFGPIFVQIYGQGECPMSITALSRAEVADRSHPRWRERLASVGRAQSICELRIGGADGAPLPPGETGEIMVRGINVMPGYWRNDAASAKTVVEGWLMTGDMGFMDADGYLTMQDRSKDVIISGGTNIYPREVEEALLTHPDVSEVSVVGKPDAEWGEVVVAFVVPRSGTEMNAQALDAHCLANIARFKRPKAYRAAEALPKNNYGKVLKTELRKRLEEEE